MICNMAMFENLAKINTVIDRKSVWIHRFSVESIDIDFQKKYCLDSCSGPKNDLPNDMQHGYVTTFKNLSKIEALIDRKSIYRFSKKMYCGFMFRAKNWSRKISNMTIEVLTRDAPEPENLPEPEPEPVPPYRRRSRCRSRSRYLLAKNTPGISPLKNSFIGNFQYEKLKNHSLIEKIVYRVFFEACGAFSTKRYKKNWNEQRKRTLKIFFFIFFPKEN